MTPSSLHKGLYWSSNSGQIFQTVELLKKHHLLQSERRWIDKQLVYQVSAWLARDWKPTTKALQRLQQEIDYEMRLRIALVDKYRQAHQHHRQYER